MFAKHVGQLVSDVLAVDLHLTVSKGTDPHQRDMQLGPRGSDYVSLETKSGKAVYFSLAQDLIVVPLEGGGFQLKTRRYWYKVFDLQPHLDDEPLFRWEYQSEVPVGKTWCRHHFQIGRVSDDGQPRKALALKLGEQTLDLNRLHTPTGFVLMEYVLRFLFADLSVVPRKHVDWEDKLTKSEKVFFTKYSGKTSTT